MNEIKINMFEAGNGDCFLIKFIGKKETNILVDFGYSDTYKKNVKEYLENMKINGEVLDLVIVTHMDQDHISGGIRFFEDNGPALATKIINVEEVWHNSYKHLNIANDNEELTVEEKKYIVSQSTYIDRNRDCNVADTSGKQGSRLAANLREYKYKWNHSFNGQAICYTQEPVILNDEVKITVLSPTKIELSNLKKIWRKELEKKFPGINLTNEAVFDDAIECISLMRRPSNRKNVAKDTSTTENLEALSRKQFDEDKDEVNASSITCIMEFKGKKILFLGDSTPAIVEAGLNRIYDKSSFPIVFDAIKVSHHGSASNISNSLLEIIDAEHYFISTNGKIYGHPDIETIAKIVTRNSDSFTRKLYFTNKLVKLEFFNNELLQERYNYAMYFRDIEDTSLQVEL